MAVMAGFCQDCGEAVTITMGENVFNQRLVWHSSYHCEKCGTAIVADGMDELPQIYVS
jgi:hypothetical protein